MVERFLQPIDRIVAEFTEIESGKNDKRLELWEAIRPGRSTGSRAPASSEQSANWNVSPGASFRADRIFSGRQQTSKPAGWKITAGQVPAPEGEANPAIGRHFRRTGPIRDPLTQPLGPHSRNRLILLVPRAGVLKTCHRIENKSIYRGSF